MAHEKTDKWDDIFKFITMTSIAFLGVTLTLVSIMYLITLELTRAGNFSLSDAWLNTTHLGAMSAIGFLLSTLTGFFSYISSAKNSKLTLNLAIFLITTGLLIGIILFSAALFQIFTQTRV